MAKTDELKELLAEQERKGPMQFEDACPEEVARLAELQKKKSK